MHNGKLIFFKIQTHENGLQIYIPYQCIIDKFAKYR